MLGTFFTGSAARSFSWARRWPWFTLADGDRRPHRSIGASEPRRTTPTHRRADAPTPTLLVQRRRDSAAGCHCDPGQRSGWAAFLASRHDPGESLFAVAFQPESD